MTDELIARLAAANPVPRDEPGLPTLAASKRRRLVVRGAVVAAAAIAAVVAALAAPGNHSGSVLGGGPGGASAAILTRMEAAIGSGQIMHVVFEGPAGTRYVDLKTGKRTPAILSEELWSNRHGYRLHLVVRVNGRVVGDLSPGDYVGSFQGPNDPAFLSFWIGYHAALENKYAPAVVGGRGTVDGRPVVWIRFPLWYNTGGPTKHGRPDPRSFPKALAQTKLALDAQTFKPILERTYVDGRRFDVRIRLVEAIPYRPPELYRRRGPKLFDSRSPGDPFGGHPFAGLTPREKKVLGLGRNAHRLRSRRVVPAPWLTAGKTVAGLGFRHVSRLLSQPLDQVGGLPLAWRGIYRAVRLVYKSQEGVTTRIDETFRPADPRPWKGLPPGSIEIQPGESVGKSGAHRVWTGYLVEHGVYITITTPAGERALLKIARTLHPVRG
ncbi:MAG TPA: hypothetical protein VJV76_06845 [Gaiellaceae bacterium]|nr:hypothetical protein [Gaiellaceae bacterium]